MDTVPGWNLSTHSFGAPRNRQHIPSNIHKKTTLNTHANTGELPLTVSLLQQWQLEAPTHMLNHRGTSC